ncbi:MAG: hypothetical protein K2O03_06920, partial [Lachnospiraceae bacterium]|nr:hypothetical protein [Lachnospiraceae bacterium]
HVVFCFGNRSVAVPVRWRLSFVHYTIILRLIPLKCYEIFIIKMIPDYCLHMAGMILHLFCGNGEYEAKWHNRLNYI